MYRFYTESKFSNTCLVVVSHDRYFMDKIVDHLFVFKGNAIIDNFPGNYSDYRTYEGNVSFNNTDAETKISNQKLIANATEASSSSETKSWKEKQHTGKLTYQEQKEYTKLEREIAQLERDKTEKEKEFLNPDLTQDQITEASTALEKIITALETKEERWFELSAKMEE